MGSRRGTVWWWELLGVYGDQDSLGGCWSLGELGVFAGLGHVVTEAKTDFGEIEIADNGLAVALLNQQHAAFAGLLIGDLGGDELGAVGAVNDDERRAGDGLQFEGVGAGRQRGVLPLDLMSESKAALVGA